MEHEVFVAVPARRLRAALADPVQVARAVPGLQQDAGTEPVAGRLKLRIGGHSITYRGALRVLARDDGTYAVEGEATESRGTGSVKLALTLRLRDTDDGATLTVDGTASADGRVAELAPDSVRAAVVRLLNRCAENLAEGTAEPAGGTGAGAETGPGPEGGEPESATELATEDFAPLATGDFEAAPDADDAPKPPPGDTGGDATGREPAEAGSAGPGPAEPSEHTSVFDTEVPPPSLDPSAEYDDHDHDHDDQGDHEEHGDDGEGVAGPAGGRRRSGEFTEAAEPPAEAAHARRTMIGRSAEEVDHAPPRGRYAPVPAPLTVSAGSALRWAAPAAALVVAGAIVMGRALRRRR
ncbi:SRPBCC domain-containing protein [Streptomyces sp. NPDC015220]|uniref:SRPBCC domain-containing protein n=1 Tax=Streptomyces sp. NPDC015220 TaxID=3364947 RepID=UPI0036F7BF34